MQPVDPAVVRHYETVREEDRLSYAVGQLELVRVQEVLQRHLPDPPASIIDIGGATGVHASWLADRGYRVRILDITPRHVEKANADLSRKGVYAQLGDARSLPYPEATFDAALVFGPLYHLTDQSDRNLALREAVRVVRQGGIVAVGALSRFASHSMVSDASSSSTRSSSPSLAVTSPPANTATPTNARTGGQLPISTTLTSCAGRPNRPGC